MGPVHSAAIEPYRVRLFVEDEIVRDAEINIGINHRGIERIMEGLPVEKANSLTEKICGICSNVHLWNSVLVAEKALRNRCTRKGQIYQNHNGRIRKIA